MRTLRRIVYALGLVFLYQCAVWGVEVWQSHAASQSLFEHLTRAEGGVVDFAEALPTAWEVVHVFSPYSSAAHINQALGFDHFKSSGLDWDESNCLVVLVYQERVVRRFYHSRGRGDLCELTRDQGYGRDHACFPVERDRENRLIVRTGPKNMKDPLGLASQLDTEVTLEGIAANYKLGAVLAIGPDKVWIDGLLRWPDGFAKGTGKGRRLRVTGTVIRRDDLPVFVPKPGELPRVGIVVQSKEDIEAFKWRFLLKDARWQELD